MSDRPYQSPVDQYGMMSPPLSTKSTTVNPASPPSGIASTRHFTQMPSQSPIPQQMTVYHQGMQVATPPQMNPIPASPYPTPSSQNSMAMDAQRWQAFLEFERQQQQKQFDRAPPNMMPQPPYVIPQGMQQQDSGYGTAQYNTLGQQHGLPGQQPPPPRPGHKYGNVTASGNARVIRGNVIDPRTPSSLVREHTYGNSTYLDKSLALEGDVTGKEMESFMRNELKYE